MNPTRQCCCCHGGIFSLSLVQIQDIVGRYGLVVISRYGHSPEKFIYESDNLTPLKVCSAKFLCQKNSGIFNNVCTIFFSN